jgi:hypothetical protein
LLERVDDDWESLSMCGCSLSKNII